MEYSPDDYTKHYIVQALFKLMNEYSFEKISVTDIAEKAGVGRATFYRYFKKKEDVLAYYLEHNAKKFIRSQHFYPRCKEDYVEKTKDILNMFRENKEVFKLFRRARLEYFYLDFLNKSFIQNFEDNFPENHRYAPHMYAGMLFNLSMAWLDDDCKEDIDSLANLLIDAIYFNK